MKAAVLLVLTAGAAAFVSACEDSISRGWLVDRTRVLGVSVSSATDPTQASLAPNERGRLTWLVAAPEGVPTVGWTFAACEPPAGNFAEPHCESPVIASGSGTATGEIVAMDLDVPSAVTLGNAQELLVLAAFCDNGTPSLDARAFTATCASGNALLASTVARLASAGPNTNPPSPVIKLGDSVLSEDEGAQAGSTCDAVGSAPN